MLGFDPVLDKQDIAAAEDWEKRLDSLIRQADTVVFLLSPRSVQSPRCAWEVERAVELSKRIVPVVVAPVPEEQVPEPLRRLNYVDFSPGQSFSRALGRLESALRADLDWIREHTRLGELARRWVQRERDEALLLRGMELAAAQDWATRWHAGAPEPTDSQRNYIAASAEVEALRRSTERQRLEEMARANASRAEALELREDALRTLRRRTVIAGAVGGGLSLALAGTGFWAWQASTAVQRARREAEEARANSALASARKEAMRTDLEGQVIVYAASPGQNAWDDSGFTPALLEQLSQQHVPLSAALSEAVKRVLAKTKGEQRPYISTDMNGDVYFQMAPPSRKRRAVVVTIDRIGEMDLPGARADGQAWTQFLRSAGFEVRALTNPRRDEVIGALYSAKVAASELAPASSSSSGQAIPPTMWVSAGVGPALPAAGSTSPVAKPSAEPKARAGPASNSFAAFYLTGFGFRFGEEDHLGMSDLPGGGIDEAALLRATVNVREVARSLRENFAASCLILDTQFNQMKRAK